MKYPHDGKLWRGALSGADPLPCGCCCLFKWLPVSSGSICSVADAEHWLGSQSVSQSVSQILGLVLRFWWLNLSLFTRLTLRNLIVSVRIYMCTQTISIGYCMCLRCLFFILLASYLSGTGFNNKFKDFFIVGRKYRVPGPVVSACVSERELYIGAHVAAWCAGLLATSLNKRTRLIPSYFMVYRTRVTNEVRIRFVVCLFMSRCGVANEYFAMIVNCELRV